MPAGLRRAADVTGRVLVAAGTLVVLFAVYQLWGTTLVQARAQDDLKDDFRGSLGAGTTTTAPPEAAEAAPLPEPPAAGEALGILRIPAIGLDAAVVQGVGRDELAKGPGHYPHSPLPGFRGNAAFAGHRTTYGAPFERLDELKAGDVVEVETLYGTFRYRVDGTSIVSPRDVEPVLDRGDHRITLTTCHPKYSARERLVVTGTLVGRPVDQPQRRAAPSPPDDALPEHLDGASSSGLRAADWGTLLVTVLLAAVGAAWWWAHRRWRGWWTRLVPALPFLVVLFVFYGEVERMLPPNF